MQAFSFGQIGFISSLDSLLLHVYAVVDPQFRAHFEGSSTISEIS